MIVDLDKDDVKLKNFQEILPKMPKEACEDFKKRSCGLILMIQPLL